MNDDPAKVVGNVVCAHNVFQDAHPKGKYSWVIEEQGKDQKEYSGKSKANMKRPKKEELSDVTIVY